MALCICSETRFNLGILQPVWALQIAPERFSSSAKETFLRSLALSAKAAALVLSQYYIPDHLNDPLRIRSLCQCLALSEAIRAKKRG